MVHSMFEYWIGGRVGIKGGGKGTNKPPRNVKGGYHLSPTTDPQGQWKGPNMNVTSPNMESSHQQPTARCLLTVSKVL